MLVPGDIALRALAGVGLLYAVFVAGLELDVRQLARHARAATLFALASFAIPFVLGIAGARVLGYTALTAVLLGVGWGSHTMVALPLLRELGLARQRAVATVVSATAATSILVVCALAAVSVAARHAGDVATSLAEVAIGLVVLVAWSLVALPRLARWLFARVGTDTARRFVFAIGAMWLGAILAEAAGIHGIVGAFLAGVGLGRAIPAASPLMERVGFAGRALFVPVFLLWVGTRLDPAVVVQPRALAYAGVFTAIVLAGKLLAALAVGRHAAYDRHEIGLMAGLSSSQVATALATLAVGERLGLFDAFTAGVVLAVVLATLVVTPIVVGAFGRALAVRKTKPIAPIGEAILVPVRGDASRPLLALAGCLAEPDMGIVVAVSVAVETDDDLRVARRLRTDAEDWLAREGLDGRALLRISRSPWAGVDQTARGEAATMLVAEWQPDLPPLPAIPVVLARGTASFDRVVVAAEHANPDVELACEVAVRLARGRRIWVVTPDDDVARTLFGARRVELVRACEPLRWIEANAHPRDLVVVAGLDVPATLARFVAVRTSR